MSYSTLDLSWEGEVAELALSGKRGALAPDFWKELPAALGTLTGVRALILKPASGDFSVGLDLAQTTPLLAGLQREGLLALLGEMQAAVEVLAQLPIPVIACVSGWCIGAGLELSLACDIRVCSSDARFSLPEVKLGIVSDLGGLGRLPHLIGEGWARRLALTGETLSAERAEQLGLVSEVARGPEEALTLARTLARQMSALPPTTLRGIKRAMNARLEGDVQAHYREAGSWNAAFLDPQLLSLKR